MQVTHSDRGAPENTPWTNGVWLLQLLSCYEWEIKVHLPLWFTVWAGKAEITTHAGIRTLLCGLKLSQQHTHTINTHTACHTCVYLHSRGTKLHILHHFQCEHMSHEKKKRKLEWEVEIFLCSAIALERCSTCLMAVVSTISLSWGFNL